jgi:1-phosphofructokinase
MIYTITLNPAIDRTLKIDNFKVNQVNRVMDIREDSGGKGINVSKMIDHLHGNSHAVMVAGGDTGEKLEKLLDNIGIHYITIANQGRTRVNTKVVDSLNNTFTDINEPGPAIDEGVLLKLDAFLEVNLKENDLLILAGSLAKGFKMDIYRRWCELGRQKGVKVILDADGLVFEEGVKGVPFMVKPNRHELEMYIGRIFSEESDLIQAAKEILAKGVYAVVISMGSEGCMAITAEGAVRIAPLHVNVVSTVGAGDSMVGAIAFGLDEMYSKGDILDFDKFAEILKLGVAASGATIEEEGSHMGSLDRVNQLYGEVELVKTRFM